MTIGVNVSGAEYSWMPFASQSDINYLASEGVTLVRLPISWERMQPTLNGPLDQTYLAGLEKFLTEAAAPVSRLLSIYIITATIISTMPHRQRQIMASSTHKSRLRRPLARMRYRYLRLRICGASLPLL